MRKQMPVIDPKKEPMLTYTMMSVLHSLFKNPYGVDWKFLKKKVFEPKKLFFFKTEKQEQPEYKVEVNLYRSMYHVRPVQVVKVFCPSKEEALESTSFFALSVLYATETSKFYRNLLFIYGDVSLQYISRIVLYMKLKRRRMEKLMKKALVPGIRLIREVREKETDAFEHGRTKNLMYYDGRFIEKLPSSRISWIPATTEFFHIQYDFEHNLGRMVYLVNLDKKVVWWTW